MRFHVEIKCEIHEDRQIRGFVSYCPAFEIYSQGRTIDEAAEALKSAVRMTLEHAFRNNRLEEMIRTARRERKEYISVKLQPATEFPVAIPLSFVSKEQEHATSLHSLPV